MKPDCTATGKRSYGTRKRALGAMYARIAEGGDPNAVYKCRECRNWHLTSKARSRDADQARAR